jgi:hypothetical protein
LFQFHFSGLLEAFLTLTKFENLKIWTSEIIQFIQYTIHQKSFYLSSSPERWNWNQGGFLLFIFSLGQCGLGQIGIRTTMHYAIAHLLEPTNLVTFLVALSVISILG